MDWWVISLLLLVAVGIMVFALKHDHHGDKHQRRPF